MIEDFLKQVYRGWVDNLNPVLSVFAGYFGEDKVDLQISVSEEDWVKDTLNFNLTAFIHNLGVNNAVEINQLFSLMADSDKILRLSDTEELAAVGINEEGVVSIIQSILEHPAYGVNLFPSEANILVWFPEVVVTNDNGRSTTIYDTYIKVSLNINGTMREEFKLCRSTFTEEQYNSGYAFSHCPLVRRKQDFSWLSCCLGSGPIRHTISNLMSECDLDIWLLFCIELEAYLRVESLQGGPYIRLESITKNKNSESTDREFRYLEIKPVIPARNIHFNTGTPDSPDKRTYKLIQGFIKYLIDNRVLNFAFVNGAYTIAHPYLQLRVLLSNAFIDYINTLDLEEYVTIEHLFTSGILQKGTITDNQVVVQVSSNNSSTNEDSRSLPFLFKNNTIPFVVLKKDTSDNFSIFLNNRISYHIINHLLTYLNYGRTKDNTLIQGNYY